MICIFAFDFNRHFVVNWLVVCILNYNLWVLMFVLCIHPPLLLIFTTILITKSRFWRVLVNKPCRQNTCPMKSSAASGAVLCETWEAWQLGQEWVLSSSPTTFSRRCLPLQLLIYPTGRPITRLVIKC